MKSFFIFQIFLQLLCQTQKFQGEGEQISIYPTQGEIMHVAIKTLWEGDSSSYEYQPKLPFIKLIDYIKEISFAKGESFYSISSNGTHFALITNNQNIILYRWVNQSIDQVDPIYPISQGCFNTLFSYQINTIIVDCYYQNNLEILELTHGKQKPVYQNQSQQPIKTKIKQIIKGFNYFTVYAQFYENYSVLTLFSQNFANLTSWISNFIDFDISQIGFNAIYVLSLNSLQYLKISDQYTFELTASISDSLFYSGYQVFFSVYYNEIINSQCDQIIVLFHNQKKTLFVTIYGCIDSILGSNYYESIENEDSEQVVYFKFNDQFYLIQLTNQVLILEQSQNMVTQSQKIKNSYLTYFNIKTNELFIFDRIIKTYQLSYPYLEINLIQYQPQLNTYDIEIYANVSILPIIPKIFISIQILNQDDVNVYVITYKNFLQNKFSLENSLYSKLSGFSGQLLQFQSNYADSQFGQFTDVTLVKVYDFYPNKFDFAQLLNTIYYPQSPWYFDIMKERIFGSYLIGLKDQKLIFYLCLEQQNQLKQTKSYSCIDLEQIPIVIVVSQLQVGYNLQSQVVAGIQSKKELQIFQLNINSTVTNFTIHLKQEFTQYLITYDNIIGLIEYQEIQIISYTMNSKIVLNESLFHEIFKGKKISFQPIQITSNVQYLSSILFINNVNNVVIVAIDINQHIIPQSIIKRNFSISSLNLVNEKLILSYQCNNQTSYCFQVWNVQNILNPYFEKELLSIQYDHKFKFMSDNLFFYVTLENQTIFIYNPYLSRHMSLFKRLDLDSIILSTTAQKQSSILFYNNTIFVLSSNQLGLFTVNESLNYQDYYPQIVYQFQVTSQLQQSPIQYTPEQSLTYLSNFTILQNVTQQVVSIDIKEIDFQHHLFTKQINIQRQITGCYLLDQNNKCLLNNINSSLHLMQNTYNYTLVTLINNTYFVLQSNLQITILNSQQLKKNRTTTSDYSFSNFSVCQISTSQGNQLFSICKNSTGQYYIIFLIDSSGNANLKSINLLTLKIYILQKISYIDNFCFILGDNELYLLNIQNGKIIKIGYQQCDDFSTFPQYQTNSQKSIVVLIFISFQRLFYSIMVLDENQFHFYLIDHNYFQSLFHYQLKFSYVTILDIQRSKLLLLTGFMNQTSWILSYKINLEIKSLIIHNIVGTIPPYGNFEILTNIQYYEGFLALQLSNGNSQFMIQIYDLSDLVNQEINQPLLIYQNQYNLSIPSYGMQINNTFKNGTIITFKNNSIYYQSINTYSITCRFKENQLNVSMVCFNDFSSGHYYFQYLLPNLQEKKQHWYYFLLSIIIILLISFNLLVKQKTKGMKYNITEIEL